MTTKRGKVRRSNTIRMSKKDESWTNGQKVDESKIGQKGKK